jgi:hypothetical protein
LKSEVAQLKRNSSNLLELYRQLRDGSAVDAWNLVEKIRSGEVPIDDLPDAGVGQKSVYRIPARPSGLVDALDTAISRHSRRTSLPAIPSPQSVLQTSHVAKRYAVPQKPFVTTNGRDETETEVFTINKRVDEPLSPQMVEKTEFSTPIHGDEDSDASLRFSLRANLDKIQEGFHMQQSCISEIFFCHSKENFEVLMSCLEQDGAEPLKSSVLCEICAVAMTAGQYVRDSLLPGLLDQWYSTPELQSIFHDKRKSQLTRFRRFTPAL